MCFFNLELFMIYFVYLHVTFTFDSSINVVLINSVILMSSILEFPHFSLIVPSYFIFPLYMVVKEVCLIEQEVIFDLNISIDILHQNPLFNSEKFVQNVFQAPTTYLFIKTFMLFLLNLLQCQKACSYQCVCSNIIFITVASQFFFIISSRDVG